jgi:hypothetical protein
MFDVLDPQRWYSCMTLSMLVRWSIDSHKKRRKSRLDRCISDEKRWHNRANQIMSKQPRACVGCCREKSPDRSLHFTTTFRPPVA